ncbi:polysaccharide deacetylase family protein [Jeotgalibacillus soli]|uniref:Polysaccharide deacetylase n=1 Tax=Jeotgalibacillus soli TaxID=889306 RepID=A0A0C2VL52_9BACL|nr:polysaccharide deacetylase family protein [Jeotgalibacillus soli]KIL44728.1 polysaccharide deacetylase [Jeotgalibacillus soli]
MKYLSVLALFSTLMLAACSTDQTNDEETVEQVNATAENELSKDIEEADEESVTETEMSQEQEDLEQIEGSGEPSYEINKAIWTVQPISDANAQVALITIDDAPDQYAVEMAEKLHSLDAPAIFFVNGHFLDKPEEEEMLRKIHELGFSIGNHTYSHANLSELTVEEQREEIISLSNRVEEIIGERPVFFRAPFGVNTDFTKQLVKEEGMLLMNWTYGYDWEAEYQDGAALADIMVNTEFLSNGANLLMHDRAWTNDALERIVNGLREKGYDIVDPAEIRIVNE